MVFLVIFLILLVIAFIVALRCIRFVPEACVVVVERMGKFRHAWETGVHFRVPFIEKIAYTISTKEQMVDFPPQQVITADNVTIDIDTIIYFRVVNAKSYTYKVEKPLLALENLTSTTLRNIIGAMKLEETLTSRDKINADVKKAMLKIAEEWGIQVNRLEVRNIIPPDEVRAAMEKEIKAEREKKAMVLIAEGEYQAAVQAATAANEAVILQAQAERKKMILEAEGQAEAVRKVQEANAEGIRLVRAAGADQAVLTLKSLEAMAKVADGKATKIIIPSDIQGIAGLATSLKEISKDDVRNIEETENPVDAQVEKSGKEITEEIIEKVKAQVTEK